MLRLSPGIWRKIKNHARSLYELLLVVGHSRRHQNCETSFTFVALIFFMAFDFLGWPGKSFPGLQLSSSLDQPASATVWKGQILAMTNKASKQTMDEARVTVFYLSHDKTSVRIVTNKNWRCHYVDKDGTTYLSFLHPGVRSVRSVVRVPGIVGALLRLEWGVGEVILVVDWAEIEID